MIHDGINCRRSRVYGWREGNPETDTDLRGQPVDSMYFVIVRIKDCRVVNSLRAKDRKVYLPEGVKPAFRMTYGGTNYGYGKGRVVRNGKGRHIRVQGQMEWMNDYFKTPVYVIRDGAVYVGAVYRQIRDGDK